MNKKLEKIAEDIRELRVQGAISVALAADNGQSHHRVGVGINDADSRFLGIVHAEMLDGAHQFTLPAAGTLLGDDGQFL